MSNDGDALAAQATAIVDQGGNQDIDDGLNNEFKPPAVITFRLFM